MSDMKIILDDFRLSYLFDIEEPVPENRLARELEMHDFKVNKQRYIVAPPLRAVLLNLARYKGTSVLYQKDSIPAFIGVAGKDILEVKTTFDTLKDVLSQIDTTVLDRSVGIEMVSTMKVFSRGLPEKAIPTLGSNKVERFKAIIGGTPILFTTQIVSEVGDKKWYIRVEPLLRSPKYYFVMLTYQDPKPDMAKVLELADRSEAIVTQIIAVVEE